MFDNSKNNWVSASQIGQAEYCAYKMYLDKKYQASKQTRSNLDYGKQQHLTYNTRFRSGTKLRLLLIATLLLIAVSAFNHTVQTAL